MSRSRRGDDRGMSLVELMVTMMITGLIAAMTAALVIGVQRTNQENVVRQTQIDEARVGVEAMSKTLRASVRPSQVSKTCTSCNQEAFLEGSRLSVQFHANINNPNNTVGPSRVTYRIPTTGADAGALIETVQKPASNIPTATGYTYCSVTAPSCAASLTTRVVARDVVTTGPAVFRYYKAGGAEMTPPVTGSLGAPNLAEVRAIEVRVTVQTGAATQARPTTYIQRIMLPNAQSVMKSGES